MINPEMVKNSLENTQKLYHFTKSATALRKILKNNTIRFGSLNTTNDPLEFLDFSFGDQKKESQEINSILKCGVKIACFSYDEAAIPLPEEIFATGNPAPFRFAYNKARMWSQYANSHRGVCLVFNKGKLIRAVQDFAQAKATELNMTLRYTQGGIRYHNGLPDIHAALADSSHSTTEHIFKYSEAYILSKLLDYQDEQEFRLAIIPITIDNTLLLTDYVEINFGDALSEIILGCKIRKRSQTYKKLLAFAELRNLQLFQMDWLNGSPFKRQILPPQISLSYMPLGSYESQI